MLLLSKGDSEQRAEGFVERQTGVVHREYSLVDGFCWPILLDL
jgi:hypothetical protein